MMQPKRILARVFLVWGVISFAGLLCLMGFLTYRFWSAINMVVDTATVSDVRVIANWSGVGEHQVESVLHSYKSGRSLTGDHADAFAIKMKHINIDELRDKENYHRGDNLPPLLADAVHFVHDMASQSQHTAGWLPSEEEFRSDQVYVYAWSIKCRGNLSPYSAQVFFLRPADRTLFYLSAKL